MERAAILRKFLQVPQSVDRGRCSTVALFDRGPVRPWPCSTVALFDRGPVRPWPCSTVGPCSTVVGFDRGMRRGARRFAAPVREADPRSELRRACRCHFLAPSSEFSLHAPPCDEREASPGALTLAWKQWSQRIPRALLHPAPFAFRAVESSRRGRRVSVGWGLHLFTVWGLTCSVARASLHLAWG
jgi:hypothetical protein